MAPIYWAEKILGLRKFGAYKYWGLKFDGCKKFEAKFEAKNGLKNWVKNCVKKFRVKKCC